MSRNPEKFDQAKVSELTSVLTDALKQANIIINIALEDLQNKLIDSSELVYLQASKILPEIIDKYGYENQSDKEKVELNIFDKNDDFTFKAAPERFSFIIYNLLKNSLYYSNTHADLKVKIGLESRSFAGKNYKVIYVHDNGPGILPQNIDNIFGNFFTFDKKGGTGLGLGFCKRNMQAFGGDIICESKSGDNKKDPREQSWTKFSLLFPTLLEEENKIFEGK